MNVREKRWDFTRTSNKVADFHSFDITNCTFDRYNELLQAGWPQVCLRHGQRFFDFAISSAQGLPSPRFAIHCCMKDVPLSIASYLNFTNLLMPLYGRTGPSRVELSFFLVLPFSLSLTHTHTHTHTYKYILLIFYVIRTVCVVTAVYHYPIHTLCDELFRTYQLLHISASRCHSQGVIITKAYKQTRHSSVTSGFHREVDEICALLGYYAASVALISYHLRGQGFWSLKMEPIGFPETSVIIYHYSLRNSPEERSSVATVGSAHPCKNGQKLNP